MHPTRLHSFLEKNFRHIVLGGGLTLGMVAILRGTGTSFFIVDPALVSRPAYLMANALGFLMCWGVIASLLSRFPLFKILAVMGTLVLGMLAERFIAVSKNPVTFPMLVLFWLGVVYLILPDFFLKYRIAILTVYGFVIAYFLFVFATSAVFQADNRLGFANLMLVPLPVFAVLWGYEQWRWLRTLKDDKSKAELALLKSQVDPHFFFNTLNNLYGLIVEKSDQAPEVVLKLADMMRYTIYEGKKDRVSLKDEIEYLETYIELHKIRYQKKVDIRFEHEAAAGIEVAPLLFIILLENAFKHGVEPMTEDAYVYLFMKAADRELYFKIENKYTVRPSSEKGGIGLDNLKKRLGHLYPDRHELSIEQTDSTYTAELNLTLS